MSVRLRWKGVDVVTVHDDEYAAARHAVRRDWRVYAAQALNLLTLFTKAAACAFAALSGLGTLCLLGLLTLVPDEVCAFLARWVSTPSPFASLAAAALFWLAGASATLGVVGACLWPRKLGFEDKFERAVIDLLARRVIGRTPRDFPTRVKG